MKSIKVLAAVVLAAMLITSAHSESIRIPAQTVTIPALNPATDIAQRTLSPFQIPLTSFRVHDALQTNLPGTPATDDLGLIGGSFGSASPVIQTGDLKAAGDTTRYARVLYQLPYSYDQGQTILIRIHSQMVTTVADTTATVDVSCYRSDTIGGVGSDLVTTSAQSNNSLTDADYDFTVTPTGMVPGDVIDIRVLLQVNDAATGTAVIGEIGSVALLCDTRA